MSYVVAITGTNGFIGRYVCQMAASLFPDIRLVPLYSIPSGFTHHSDRAIAEGSSLSSKLSECDVLLLLGAHSTVQPYSTHLECVQQNIVLNMHLLENARISGITKILAVGTCFEYGLSALNEDFLTPNSLLLPIGSYPSSKAAFCVLALDWAMEFKIKLIYSRLFQIYGQGEHPSRLYPLLLNAAHSGKDFTLMQPNVIRDFMHVNEAAKCLLDSLYFLLKCDQNFSPTIENICSGIGTSVKDFASSIWSNTNSSGTLFYGTNEPRRVDIPRIVGQPFRVFDAKL